MNALNSIRTSLSIVLHHLQSLFRRSLSDLPRRNSTKACPQRGHQQWWRGRGYGSRGGLGTVLYQRGRVNVVSCRLIGVGSSRCRHQRPGKVRTQDTICGFPSDWTKNPLRVDHRDSGKIRARSSDILGLIAKRHNHASGADGVKIAVSRKGPAGLAFIKAAAHQRSLGEHSWEFGLEIA